MNEHGLVFRAWAARQGHISWDSRKKYLDFLKENSQLVQAIQNASQMQHIPFADTMLIVPFTDMLDILIEDKDYAISFRRYIKMPISAKDLDEIINSFVIFYPIYDSVLRIAKGEKIRFEELVSMLKFEDLYPTVEDELDTENEEIKNELTPEEEALLARSTDIKNTVRAGIRWQVFERDDFKCVACGSSAKENAILHIDHILPRTKGSKDEMDNYQTLCHKYNIDKSNKSDRNLMGVKNATKGS